MSFQEKIITQLADNGMGEQVQECVPDQGANCQRDQELKQDHYEIFEGLKPLNLYQVLVENLLHKRYDENSKNAAESDGDDCAGSC